MVAKPPVYRKPQSGQPLISTISTGCKTPLLEVKFCNLVKPFYYPNSPTIPRYSVTCLADPTEHKDFILGIQTIENNENVETIIKNDTVKKDGQYVTTGKVIIKFQSKDMIPVFVNDEQIILEDEFSRGEKISILYDILRYTKKNTMKVEHGISFKPSRVDYFPEEQLERSE